ncbi:MAG: hypothetical protein HKN67_02535 [Saprospiraceae bacterium]|nr:hypothetical protein [Bacteroidia bacterium]MBT8229636.1 hypothetical protein [Bacteroidia bacterium]NNF20792.1 hypothetical protein [Saprospiraceae bacterium]
MYKLKVYRLFMLVAGLCLIFSTSGLAIDAHFCTGKLKRIKVFGHAKTCLEVVQKKKSCCSKTNADLKVVSCAQGNHDKGCCSNEQINMDLELDYNIISDQQCDLTIPVFLQRTSLEILPIQLTCSKGFLPKKEYSPPGVIPNYILFQQFLC